MGLVRLCLALAVAFSLAFPAASQDWSYGNGFYASCSEVVAPTGAKPNWPGIACLGYVKGLHDMAGFMWSSGRIRPEVCPPSGVSMSQYYDILLKYLKDNPDKRHEPTAALLWEAASASFPCPR
jgi:hypothetical protein